MCFFKRKKKIVISGNKYSIGQMVNFKHRGEMCPGIIYQIKMNDDQEIIYDVQIGGECPAVIENVKEELIHARR